MKGSSIMKKLPKIVSVLLTVLLSVALISTVSTKAVTAKSTIPRILIIMEDSSLFDRSLIADYADDYDIVDSKKVDYSALSDYSCYAVPSGLVKSDKRLCEAVKNSYRKYETRVYMYGKATISDFKRAFGIKSFGADVSVYDTQGPTTKTAFISFGKDQEDNMIENIISYSNSQTQKNLLATVYQGDNVIMEYMKIILQDYASTKNTTKSSVIVKSGFNYRSYFSSAVYANMDFMLYRDFSELDPNYDYFAIKTNISTTGCDTARVEAEHRMQYISDEMIDYGPGDIHRAGSVTVGLDLGSGWGGGGISYTFEVGGGPTIDASYYAGDDYCTWIVSRHWPFGGDLVHELFCLGSSWASTGTYAATNIKFRALFDVYVDFMYSPWCEVQVRYDY